MGCLLLSASDTLQEAGPQQGAFFSLSMFLRPMPGSLLCGYELNTAPLKLGRLALGYCPIWFPSFPAWS